MFIYHEQIAKQDIGEGVIFQYLAKGQNLNVFHWNMADGSVVPMHQHPEEQFGYVIKGGFDIYLEGNKFTIGAGDAYIIPSEALHSFTAIGETEAIDVFAPVKQEIPGE